MTYIFPQKINTGQQPLKQAIVGMLNTGVVFVKFWVLLTFSDLLLLVEFFGNVVRTNEGK